MPDSERLSAYLRAAIFILLTGVVFGWTPAAVAVIGGGVVHACTRQDRIAGVGGRYLPWLFLFALYLSWGALRLASIEMIGLSYLALKLHHLAVTADRKGRAPSTLAETWILLAFPATFAAGPIERDGFARRQKVAMTGPESVAAVRRIAEGVFKKVVCVTILEQWISRRGGIAGVDDVLGFLVMANLAAWSLYLDFSAYSDIAIGAGRLLGYRLTENFSWPLFTTNILDFWRRWHASLTAWLRDHIFFPAGQLLGRASCPMRLAGALSAAATFLLMGLWHGIEPRYLAFGAYHAAGVVICNEWRGGMPRVVGWLITYLFVIVGFLVFRYPPAEVTEAIVRIIGAMR
jgi:alginate O-acetyltransferase complex protein AlgI